MSTQVQTKDADAKMIADTKTIPLSAVDQAEVEKTFSEAKDFRQLGEKITAPLDSIISETAKIIDADPIMNVSDELSRMNGEVQSVYKDIINSDGTIMKIAKSIPIVSTLAKTLDAKWDEAKFNIKSMEGKIETIFDGFDQSGVSLNTSIDMQKAFLEGIEENLGKVVAYKDFLQVSWKSLRKKQTKSQMKTKK